MSNFNLPPGVTNAMIDRAMGGDDPRCWGCGEETDQLEYEWYRGDFRYLCKDCCIKANRD